MIKLPNLDDQNYADIVEAAKRRIPVIFPEWTDFNEHDPGITMIELFAWLKEMQQYYLNRISDKSYENMLRLLGTEVYSSAPAEASVCFGEGSAPEKVTRGSTARAKDGTVFTAYEDFRRSPFIRGSVYIENPDGFVDITGIATSGDTTFFPFGDKLNNEGCRLYIKLEDIDKARFFDGITLHFSVSDKCRVKRNPVGSAGCTPRDIVWEYSTAGDFAPCEVISDSTYALSFSGAVTLRTGNDIAPCRREGLPEGIWLRCRLTYCGCEDMPQLRLIYTNEIKLSQRRTDAAYMDFVLGEDIFVRDMLAAGGMCFVMLRDANGWRYIQDAPIEKTSDGVKVNMDAYSDLAAADGEPDVRVVYCTEDFGRTKMFMSSDGLPCQQFDFDADGQLLVSEIRIMVCDREDSREPRWREYSCIESMELAGPYDRCFSYDAERRRLVFGDNENGEAPPRGSENIMIISCAATKGAGGNLPPGSLTEIECGSDIYAVSQYDSCRGGMDRESFRHAMDRMKLSLSECTRAVTAEDYRTLALRTPGLRIADAKAVSGAAANEFGDAGIAGDTNEVSLVVLPFSSSSFPMPDKRFLAAVQEHIENYRLITTKVDVVAPVYVKIDISADMVCDTREVQQAKRRSEEAIRSLLSVYGKDGRTRFGEPVGESDIITAICSVDGILSVKRLNISTEMHGCSRDRYGRLIIPYNAIAYCGEVSLNVTEP